MKSTSLQIFHGKEQFARLWHVVIPSNSYLCPRRSQQRTLNQVHWTHPAGYSCQIKRFLVRFILIFQGKWWCYGIWIVRLRGGVTEMGRGRLLESSFRMLCLCWSNINCSRFIQPNGIAVIISDTCILKLYSVWTYHAVWFCFKSIDLQFFSLLPKQYPKEQRCDKHMHGTCYIVWGTSPIRQVLLP